MSIDYEKISDEWLEYIGKLDFEERKKKFKEYLEASGVYDLDSSTQFYLSELNNFLTEGITTLLHDKAQAAKKSGKGLAHYRHTSFALSKPDAMNLVHEYIHNKILTHPVMLEQEAKEMPNKFEWDFLFNIPEYVFHKPLLTENDIPALPEPRKISSEHQLNYSPEQFTDVNMDNAEFSPDPFDIDEQQKVIENLKEKFISNPSQEQPESNGNENDEEAEYSPDPYDIDENQEKYVQQHLTSETAVLNVQDPEEPITFAGVKHGSMPSAQPPPLDTNRQTKVVKKRGFLKKLQREPSNYLDEWIEKDTKPGANGDLVIIDDKQRDAGELNQVDPDTPNHKRPGSTIQGGYWKNQVEQTDKVMSNLNDASEHRDQILRAINDANDSNGNQHKDTFDSLLNVQRIVQNITNDMQLNNEQHRERQREREREREREKQKEREYNDQKDSFERKIKEFERQIEDLQLEIATKDKLIQKQSIQINEFETNQDMKHSMNMMKKELLQEIQTQFLQQQSEKKHSSLDNQKVNEIIDKTEDIMLKVGSLQKFQQQMKQQYTLMSEQVDGLNENYEKYYHQTTKKMAEYHSKLSENINNIEINIHREEKSSNASPMNMNNVNGVVVSEMAKLTTLTSQITQEMGAASMLSVMREEYERMRKEKEHMHGEVERYRKENQQLQLKKLELEEEAINVRESKRRTIKNLVDELNDLRDQIHRLSKKQRV